MISNRLYVIGFVLYFAFTCRTVSAQTSYCPSASSIFPCTCLSPSSTNIAIDCSAIESEDQLEQIFTTASFYYSNIRNFTIADNNDLRYLTRNVFGTSVTFKIITFKNVSIEYIDEVVFLNSKSYLQEWNILSCPMIGPGFPFASLNLYATTFTHFRFENSGDFAVFPRIHSATLQYLSFQHCRIDYLPVLSFDDIPNLTWLYLIANNLTTLPQGIFDSNLYLKQVIIGENKIYELETGTFKNLAQLEDVNLGGNKINFIAPGALYNLPKLENVTFSSNELSYFLSSGLGYLPAVKRIGIERNNIQISEKYLFNSCPTLEYFTAGFNRLTHVSKEDFQGSAALQELNLHWNNISAVEAGSFTDLNNGLLNLNYNQLTYLNEDWLKTVLENRNMVKITGNNLYCGCDIAWLFQTPTLMSNLTAICSNGTDIHNLDPSYFSSNC